MQIRTFAKEPAGRMRLALFEPDIPQNCGTILRLATCLGVVADIIEPCGFLWDDRRLRRAGMDYLAGADVTRHESWAAFERQRHGRLLLLTTRAERSYLGHPDPIYGSARMRRTREGGLLGPFRIGGHGGAV